MKRKKCSIIPFSVIILLLIQITTFSLQAQDISDNPVRFYDLGDWLSYKNCNFPSSLSEGREYIYFGTNGGIVLYHKYGKYWEAPYTVSDGLADDFILAVLYNKDTGVLWASHRAGVSYLLPTADRWENINKDFLINRLGADEKGVWGLDEYGQIHEIKTNFGDINSNSVRRENIVWGPSYLDGVPDFSDYFIDGPYQFLPDGVIIDNELREFSLDLFFVDSNQDIYGGARNLGMILGDENVKNLRVHQVGPMQNHINAIAMSENYLWMSGNITDPAYKKNGISCYNLYDGEWTYYENYFISKLVTDQVFDIQYNKNELWIGTNQGISIFNTKKNQWDRITVHDGLQDENIWTIGLEDSIAWIGTPFGLHMVYLPGKKVKKVQLSSLNYRTKIFKIVVGVENIWVGTDNGLYGINRKNHFVSHFGMMGEKIDLNAAVAGQCSAIGVSNFLVLVRLGNSFYQYNKQKNEFQFNTKISIIDNRFVYDIKIVYPYVWLGTDNGAILIDMNNFIPEIYKKNDGLSGKHVFRIIPDGEWIWFATEKGLTKYNWRKYAQSN